MEKGMEIKMFLTKNHLTQNWLCHQLTLAGLHYDKSTVSCALNGSIKGNRVNVIIDNSFKILNKYESKMNNDIK